MSTGHAHQSEPPQGWRAIIAQPAVQRLIKRARNLNREFDIPYLAGYSTDGTTIYIDRHMPEEVKYRGKAVPTDRFLELHEAVEKALIDALGWGYLKAHAIAEAAEEDAERAAHCDPAELQKCFAPYIKADEVEKLQRCPPDLDMTPYRGNAKLETAIRAAQAAASKAFPAHA